MAWRLLWATILLASGTAGCRICDNPYDYCGPVMAEGFHPLGSRAGSVNAVPAMMPEPISPPPTPPLRSAPQDGNGVLPAPDPPSTMDRAENSSVMHARLRHAR